MHTINASPLRCTGCTCGWRFQRRLFTGALLASGAGLTSLARAREGVEVGKPSALSNLVSAEQIEQAAEQQYRQMLSQAAQQKALAPASHPQVVRLRAISQRLIPYSFEWNDRARNWRWEVNLLGSKQINAFCMPGVSARASHPRPICHLRRDARTPPMRQ